MFLNTNNVNNDEEKLISKIKSNYKEIKGKEIVNNKIKTLLELNEYEKEKEKKAYSFAISLIKVILFIISNIIIVSNNIETLKYNKSGNKEKKEKNNKDIEKSDKLDNIDTMDKYAHITYNLNDSSSNINMINEDTNTDIVKIIPDSQKLLNLYICTHKDFPDEINNTKYYKILCDKRNQLNGSYSLEIIPTDKNNELYQKSHGYGECSKIYYIWKQYKIGNISSKYVGFNHYSKIFKFKNKVPNMEDNIYSYS